MDRSRRRIEEPACAGPGGAACRGLSSSIFSRRAFSARSRASSASTAVGNLSHDDKLSTCSYPMRRIGMSR